MKNVRSGQASISINPYIELSKTKFSPVSIVKNLLLCFWQILNISQNVGSITEKYKHICFGKYYQIYEHMSV